MRATMRSVIVVVMVWAAAMASGCADLRDQTIADCPEFEREETMALLGISMRRECKPDFPSAMDFGGWRLVNSDVSIGGDVTTCVYRSQDGPRPRGEIVTVNGVPVDASVTLPPRTTCECIATVGEVCMPDGVCARIE